MKKQVGYPFHVYSKNHKLCMVVYARDHREAATIVSEVISPSCVGFMCCVQKLTPGDDSGGHCAPFVGDDMYFRIEPNKAMLVPRGNRRW